MSKLSLKNIRHYCLPISCKGIQRRFPVHLKSLKDEWQSKHCEAYNSSKTMSKLPPKNIRNQCHVKEFIGGFSVILFYFFFVIRLEWAIASRCDNNIYNITITKTVRIYHTQSNSLMVLTIIRPLICDIAGLFVFVTEKLHLSTT